MACDKGCKDPWATPNKREALQLAGLEPVPHAPFPAAALACAAVHVKRTGCACGDVCLMPDA